MTTQSPQKEKATFTLSFETKKDLFRMVPSTKRSRFVDSALKQALNDIARQKSIEMLKDIKRSPA